MRLSDLRSGDLLYWRGKGFYAWLARVWTRSPWSHVAVFFWNGGTPCFIDASIKHGVRAHEIINDWPDAAQHSHSAWTDATRAWALRFEGEPYGWLDAIRGGFGLPANHRGYMCSEFVALVMRYMGWGWPHNAAPTPQRIAEVVEAGMGFTPARLEP